MIVTFCGHRIVLNPTKVETWLTQIIKKLIQQGATTFYLGGYGEFDSLCKKVLLLQKQSFPVIELVLVLPYLKHNIITTGYDATIYPDLESTPPRYAIIKRNQWMVEQADHVICYVTYNSGGAYQTLSYARRKKKSIICYPN